VGLPYGRIEKHHNGLIKNRIMNDIFYVIFIALFTLLGAWYAPKMTLAMYLFGIGLTPIAIVVMIMSLMTEITIKFDKKDLDNLN
jgi:FtsH-binding integral membrane protein